MKRQNKNEDYRWIIQGSIAVPTGNPLDPSVLAEFESRNLSDSSNNKDCLWLGPGLKILLDHVLAVNPEGIIAWLAPARDSQEILQEQGQELNNNAHMNFLRLDPLREFLCPGMIDLHIHAPQFAYTGTATDRPLTGPNGWLEHYTFPAESRLQNNIAPAHQVYEAVVKTTLRSGTTTAVYFGTLHLQPNQVLVDAALEYGQRALVGKVCMDRNAPEDYVQTLQENLQETKEFIAYIQNNPKNNQRRFSRDPDNNEILPLVMPVITPRFIPTCTPQLLTALGGLAAEHQCHITSHISESVDEVAWSRQLDLEDHALHRTDASVFHSHNLLTDRCIMAHGVHLSEEDADLLKQQGSAIAHCPLSNFCFAGGYLDCQQMLRRGNKLGLGTDVAGGYSPSMMNAARMAVVASQSLQLMQHGQVCGEEEEQQQQKPKQQPLDYRHSIYLATLGGAQALGLDNQIGTLRVGMELDAMVLSANTSNNMVSVFQDYDCIADIFQKLWVLGDDRNVTHVFVQGREVKKAMTP